VGASRAKALPVFCMQYVYVNVHIYMCSICIWICVYICICVYIRMYVCIYVYMQIHVIILYAMYVYKCLCAYVYTL